MNETIQPVTVTDVILLEILKELKKLNEPKPVEVKNDQPRKTKKVNSK